MLAPLLGDVTRDAGITGGVTVKLLRDFQEYRTTPGKTELGGHIPGSFKQESRPRNECWNITDYWEFSVRLRMFLASLQ